MKWLNEKTEGLINFSDLKKPYVKIVYVLFFLILLLLMAVCVLPVIWAVLSAFKEPAEMYQIPTTFFPKKFDITAIGRVLEQVNILPYFTSTMCIIAGCWIIDVVFNGFAGYVLSKIRPTGTRLIETLIFWSMMLPGMGMAALYMTFVDLPIFHINITGTYLPIWIMSGCNAFNIMLMRNFFNGIPKEYMEAARIDGCSDTGIFFRIMLPLAKPVIAVVSIYSIIGSWNNFMWPYLLLGGTDKEPLAVLLFQISNGTVKLQDNEILMVTMIVAIPTVLIYGLLSKHISGGLNMSGIKG